MRVWGGGTGREGAGEGLVGEVWAGSVMMWGCRKN